MPDADIVSGGPVASVVVPTHRGAHRLPMLLDHLAEQDFGGSWEVVVVLDGVVDDTPRVLDSYESLLPMRRIMLPQAAGVGHALNAGYGAAAGRVLIRCDDDLTPRPDMITRHVAHHDGGHLVGVVGLTRDVFPPTAYARAYGARANQRAIEAGYAGAPVDRWIHWAAHNSMSRAGWERVGGFDESFPYGEDSELGWRLQQAGVELVIDPALEIEHRGPTTSAADRVPRAYIAGASRRLFDKVHPNIGHPVMGPTGVAARVWDLGTSLTACFLRTRGAYRRVGGLVDRLLRVVPEPIGARLVAFAVESAAKSGSRHGSTDLFSFSDQKSREVGSELSSRG